jgi:hypothetical protein
MSGCTLSLTLALVAVLVRVPTIGTVPDPETSDDVRFACRRSVLLLRVGPLLFIDRRAKMVATAARRLCACWRGKLRVHLQLLCLRWCGLCRPSSWRRGLSRRLSLSVVLPWAVVVCLCGCGCCSTTSSCGASKPTRSQPGSVCRSPQLCATAQKWRGPWALLPTRALLLPVALTVCLHCCPQGCPETYCPLQRRCVVTACC